MEVVKDISAVFGVIISAASLLTLMSKTARQAIISLFEKYGNSDKTSESIAEIKQLLEQHLDEDKKFKDDISEMNDINMEFTRTQCRNIIKNIFYKYDKVRVLPLYEKKTLMSVENLYVNRLHGNSYALMMLNEMSTWEVDYENSHPCESEG